MICYNFGAVSTNFPNYSLANHESSVIAFLLMHFSGCNFSLCNAEGRTMLVSRFIVQYFGLER